jgi:Transposase domain (DUF772)
MRGKDEQQLDVFSYVSPERRVPHDHPLRPLRAMTDEAFRELQPRFHKLYARTGRPSIAPEKLLRALLLQALYSVRSERLLMGQLDYNLAGGQHLRRSGITRVTECCIEENGGAPLLALFEKGPAELPAPSRWDQARPANSRLSVETLMVFLSTI